MSIQRSAEWLGLQDNAAKFSGHFRRTPQPFARLFRAIATMRQRARERQELHGLSDTELRDIGIARGDIDRVFGPAFVREYSRRGDLPGSGDPCS
ncbi:MAG: DUF1127 domain-containing protein [Acetobacteraceae bacterium]|nr:DUF1127 domain-containing protein [Acetobacteraceae bacterium]